MRNEIAEWMLSQAAPPEQAKTILGDLLEEQLGPVKFWCSVLQTAASIAGRDPRRSVVSFTGIAIGLGFYAIFAWIISVGFNPRHPFIAVYGVVVGLFALWQAVVRLVIRRICMRFPITVLWSKKLSNFAFAVFFVWWLKHVWGWSLASAFLAASPFAVYGWWSVWHRRRANTAPGNNRPAAG